MAQKAYIVNGFRTAIGKAGKGGFRFSRPDDLAADVIKHLMSTVPKCNTRSRARIKYWTDDLINGIGHR